MDKAESLKDVERRAYRATFEDGFYDLLWGGVFLLFAWIPILESIGIPRFCCYLSILVLGLIPWLGKRYVTTPRLGAVEFGEKRKTRRRYTALIGVVAIVLMLPAVIMMFANGFPGHPTWETVALIAALPIVVGVSLMNYSRMYIYGMLFLFSVVASRCLLKQVGMPFSNLVAFGVPGTAIAGYGLSLLLKFLKEYPKPAGEAQDVSR